MVAALVIHAITWITTHLPTPEGWKAEFAWLVDPSIDQAQIRECPPARDRRPNHWAPPPSAGLATDVRSPRKSSSSLSVNRMRRRVEVLRLGQFADDVSPSPLSNSLLLVVQSSPASADTAASSPSIAVQIWRWALNNFVFLQFQRFSHFIVWNSWNFFAAVSKSSTLSVHTCAISF